MSINRNQAADTEYQSYDFGEAGVEDASGWEHTSPGDVWTRAVFIRTDDDNKDSPSQKITFTVRFAVGTDDVVEAYAIDGNGSIWGTRAQPPAPIEPLKLTVELTLMRQPNVFADDAAALAWITSCLNCNVNHVRADVALEARSNDRRTTELENALRAMWVIATSVIDKHGLNGDDSLTDSEHAEWQAASADANRLIGGQ